MFSRYRILAAASFALWVGATAFAQKSTTNDGVYTKAQADAAKKQFDTLCASCHTFSPADRKKPSDVLLGGETFFASWNGRPLSDMVSLIALTMPNDGSATLTDAEAADLVAYILQRNGYAAGSRPLTKEASAVIEKPKK